MTRQDYELLFNSIYPDFFEHDYIKSFADGKTCDEMIMELKDFDETKYVRQLPENVTFGYYEGDLEILKEAVNKVDEGWLPYYDGKMRAYCGFIDGKIASFCLLEEMGTYTIGGKTIKVAGPGCVGTIPELRNGGIGLTMVKNATRILKEEGFDYSFIHYTGVAPWYAKLGYKTILTWSNHGFVEK